jgi:hypothetical protein
VNLLCCHTSILLRWFGIAQQRTRSNWHTVLVRHFLLRTADLILWMHGFKPCSGMMPLQGGIRCHDSCHDS